MFLSLDLDIFYLLLILTELKFFLDQRLKRICENKWQIIKKPFVSSCMNGFENWESKYRNRTLKSASLCVYIFINITLFSTSCFDSRGKYFLAHCSYWLGKLSFHYERFESHTGITVKLKNDAFNWIANVIYRIFFTKTFW